MIKKRILCMFLTALLLFTGLVPVSTDVSAAKQKITEISTNGDVVVESGRTFYIGDMVDVTLEDKDSDMTSVQEENGPGDIFYTATELGATYVSDHPAVLDVQEKSGYAQAKEPGTATVTVDCQGVYISFPVTVAEKGTLHAALREGKEDLAEKLDAAGRKLAKKIPDKLTVENGYELIRAMKTYVAAFTDFYSTYEFKKVLGTSSMLIGWSPEMDFRMAPACSCYKRARHMMNRYIVKYHPMYQKKYWTAKDGTYFKVSAKPDRITLKFKKKINKQALLALYFNDLRYELDGLGPDGVTPPLAISTTVQKDRFDACCFIGKYKDKDQKYIGHTVITFKLGSKAAEVTHVYATRVNQKTHQHKHIQKKKLSLKKGKKYQLRVYTFNFYWPGEFVVK